MLPDKRTQRRIWQRVYAAPYQAQQPRRQLQECQARARANLRFYESRLSDPVCGPAYAHLAEGCRQALAMLQQLQQLR